MNVELELSMRHLLEIDTERKERQEGGAEGALWRKSENRLKHLRLCSTPHSITGCALLLERHAIRRWSLELRQTLKGRTAGVPTHSGPQWDLGSAHLFEPAWLATCLAKHVKQSYDDGSFK